MVLRWEIDTSTWDRVNERVALDESGSFTAQEEVVMVEALGQVGTSRGLTLNLGNYESAKIDVWVSFPCTPDEADSVFEKAAAFCDERLQVEVLKIKNNS